MEILAYIAAYFIPVIIAAMRGHRSAGSIAVITLFLGWTVLGWVVALAWAFSGNVNK